MIVLFVLTWVVAALGVGLMALMYRRDQPILGLGGMCALLVATVLAVVYGTLDTI